MIGLSACAGSISEAVPIRIVAAEDAPSAPVSPESQPEPGQDTTPAIAFENNIPLAARVNHEPIFLETFEKQVAQMTQALQAQGTDLSSEAGQETLAQVKRQVLEALIDQLLIEQQANSVGIVISQEMVEAKAQESIAQGPGKVQFAEWLAANNLSYEEFKETLRSQLMANQMFEYITRDVPERAEQIHLRQIQVADEATARAIIEQLKQGADFARLAQEQSLDESSRANGGDLGWFSRGLGPIPPEVEAVAFSLQPGQISGPIRPAVGFYIIKLEEREVDRPLTKPMLQALKQQKFMDWLAGQRASAIIERFIEL